MVIFDVENDVGSISYLVYQQGFTRLYARAAFVSCSRPTLPPALPQPEGQTGVTTLASQRIVSGVPSTPAQKRATTLALAPVKPAGPTKAYASGYTNETTTHVCPTPSTETTAAQCATQDHQATNTRQNTWTYPSQDVTIASETLSTTWIPTMTVEWQTTRELSGAKYASLVPFLTFAGLGAYLTARAATVTTTTTIVAPTVPGIPTKTVAQGTQQNNSTLPYGIALFGTSFSSLGSGSVGGLNQSTLLKRAAAALAVDLVKQIDADCVIYSFDLCTRFQFTKAGGPLPAQASKS